MFDKWKGSLSNLDQCLMDVTCYESHLYYPTDIKLLWEGYDWLHALMKKTCPSLENANRTTSSTR